MHSALLSGKTSTALAQPPPSMWFLLVFFSLRIHTGTTLHRTSGCSLCVCAVVVILLEAWKDAHAPRCARAAAPSQCMCMLGSVGLWRRCVCSSAWTMEPPEDGRILQLIPTPSRGVLRCHCGEATVRLPRLLHEPTSTSLLHSFFFVVLPLSLPTWCVHAHHVIVPRV